MLSVQKSKPEIDSLVEDIYGLFLQPHKVNQDNVTDLGKTIALKVAEALGEDRESRTPTLRMSNLGKPDRQLWYTMHGEQGEKFSAPNLIKFLFGHILEALLLFLAVEAGHEVTNQQDELILDGIVGHNDAVIDGVTVDVKSASTHSFKKFKYGTLAEDDPFGYMDQLAGYTKALGTESGAFLAIDKTLGNIALMKVSGEELEAIDIMARIPHIKTTVASDVVPERCYEDVPDGKSGNMTLAVGCSYCAFKKKCWADTNNGVGLRVFQYSSGPRYLTKVVREPDVLEITI